MVYAHDSKLRGIISLSQANEGVGPGWGSVIVIGLQELFCDLFKISMTIATNCNMHNTVVWFLSLCKLYEMEIHRASRWFCTGFYLLWLATRWCYSHSLYFTRTGAIFMNELLRILTNVSHEFLLTHNITVLKHRGAVIFYLILFLCTEREIKFVEFHGNWARVLLSTGMWRMCTFNRIWMRCLMHCLMDAVPYALFSRK